MNAHSPVVTAAKGVFIDNDWRPAASGRTVPVVAPAEGVVFAEIAAGGQEDVNRAVKAARRAVEGGVWGRLSATERGRLLSKLSLANGTDYGLMAAVWSHDGNRAMRVARGIKAGQVYINAFGARGGIELPLGGMKKSGHGREKGFEALHDVSTLRTTILKHG